MSSFENKVAIITGGSSGISKAKALELAKQGAFAAIAGCSSHAGENVVNDTDTKELINYIGWDNHPIGT